MARIKTKDLKDRYLFRVYDENESELLHRAITKFKDKFDSLNDAIKYFALVGACGFNVVLEALAATIICAAVFAGLFVAGKKHSKLSEEK